MSYVIRARYCQPDGIGWVGKDGSVYSDPNHAYRFAAEDDAWMFIALHGDLCGQDEQGEYAWPEEAKDYTPEERRAIVDEVRRKHDAYYNWRPDGEDD